MGGPAIAGLVAMRFGDFEYRPTTRTLLHDNTEITVGSRALALLEALLARAGQVVSPTELVAAAWPDTHVDGCNLRAQVATLRRAIDLPGATSHVRNVPGRGYALVTPVEPVIAAMPAPMASGLHPQHALFHAAPRSQPPLAPAPARLWRRRSTVPGDRP